MSKKKFTLEVEVDVVPNKKGTMPVRMHVEGMMQMIRRAMPDKDKQDLLDEYAKFYIMRAVGVETYPLEK